MDVYIYQAEFYCEDCGKAIRKQIDDEGNAPSDPDDEYTYDSDHYPKGGYPDGGGEADCPNHCGGCGVFLENDLTTDGVDYLRERYTDCNNEIVLPMEYYEAYQHCFNDDEVISQKS